MGLKEKIEKLMRLAAPNSGATAPERESAALEAAKLFAESDLAVTERPAKPVRQPPPQSQTWWPPTPRPTQVAYGYAQRAPQFRRSRAPMAGVVCKAGEVGCGQLISGEDEVWRRVKGTEIEYLHIDCPSFETYTRRRFEGFDDY